MKNGLLLLGCFWGVLANGQTPWSGVVEFAVEPIAMEDGDWDYIPQTVTYETNGADWRILERGTSFERIWLGRHGAAEYHILFHFLGHAVELLEGCPPADGNTNDWQGTEWGVPPCPWLAAVQAGALHINDGPARYALRLESMTEAKPTWWDRRHFAMPPGYEPMEKFGLAALMQSLAPAHR